MTKKIIIVLCIVIFPAFFAMLINEKCSNIKNWIKKYLKWSVITFLLFVLCNIFAYLKKIVLTKYEYIYISLICIVLIVFLVSPIFNKKFNIKFLLKTVFFVSIITALYSCLTYGQTSINSDTATSFLLARSQIENRSIFPSNWCYVNGDLWVLAQNILAIPITYIIKNQTLARMVQTCVLLLITVVCMTYQGKKLFLKESYWYSVPIFLIFMYGNLDMILYQAGYTTQMVIITLVSTLLGTILINKNSFKETCAFCVIILLVAMGGIRGIAETSIPLLGALICLFFYDNYNKKIKECEKSTVLLIKQSALIILPTIIGLTIYYLIASTHIMGNSVNNSLCFVGSIQEAGANFCTVFLNCFDNFGYTANVKLFSINGLRNILAIFICLFFAFIIPVLEMFNFKKERKEIQLFLAFSVIHNLIMILMAVLFGTTTSRYLLTSIFLCILINSYYISNYWAVSYDTLWANVIVLLYTCSVIYQSFVICSLSFNWTDSLNKKAGVIEQLNEYGLKHGYSTYWNAYSNVLYSNFEIKIGAVNIDSNGVSPFYWLVDKTWFDADIYNGETFLMLDKTEIESESEEKLDTIFGEPEYVFELIDYDKKVYVYDYNIMQVLK